MPASKSGTPDKFALNMDFLFDEFEVKCRDFSFNKTNLGEYMGSDYQKIHRHTKGKSSFFKPEEYFQIATYMIGKLCANTDNREYLSKRCRMDCFIPPENDTTINKIIESMINDEIITNYNHTQFVSPLDSIVANLDKDDKRFVDKFIFAMKNENFKIESFALNMNHLFDEFRRPGFTYEELGKILGADKSKITHYVQGKSNFTDDDYTKTVKYIIKTSCERSDYWENLLNLCKSIESDESINKILDGYKNLPEQIINNDPKIPSAIVDAIIKIMKKEIFKGIDYKTNTVDVDSYTVKFDSNGGTDIIPQIAKHGATATEPNNPAKAGYVFVGWQHNGEKFHFNIPITGDITLVAEWEKSHRVIFVANDGIEIVPKIVPAKHGDIIQEPKNPTRAGHIFMGWRCGGEKFYFNTPITDDITLVAEWATYGSVVMALPSPHIEKLENMISLDTVLKNAHESFFVSGVSNISLKPRRDALLKRSEKISIRILISNLKNKELQHYQKYLRRILTFEDNTIDYMDFLVKNGNGNIQVRVADFIMPAFFVASDIEDSTRGTVLVAHTLYNTSSAERPRLQITPAHGEWYELYRKQIDEIWEHSVPF